MIFSVCLKEIWIFFLFIPRIPYILLHIFSSFFPLFDQLSLLQKDLPYNKQQFLAARNNTFCMREKILFFSKSWQKQKNDP